MWMARRLALAARRLMQMWTLQLGHPPRQVGLAKSQTTSKMLLVALEVTKLIHLVLGLARRPVSGNEVCLPSLEGQAVSMDQAQGQAGQAQAGKIHKPILTT